MTGIEILATEEVAVAFGFGWNAFYWMLILGGIFAIGIAIVAAIEGGIDVGLPVFAIIFSIVMLLSCVLGACTDGKPTEYETRYKVLISDEAPTSEFLEKYEIVDRDGKIFTIIERE